MKDKAPKPIGRKPIVDGEVMGVFAFRLTKHQREKLRALGGQDWLRERINKAKLVAK